MSMNSRPATSAAKTTHSAAPALAVSVVISAVPAGYIVVRETTIPFNPEYGLIAVFAAVLVQQLGAPIPVLPVMLLAGAQSASDPFYGIYALALALVASTIGSLPWFWAGQRYGHRILKLTCR